MSDPFFEHPILNSPYACPERHWELNEQGQPTQRIVASRRRAEFITPIPKPRKRRSVGQQAALIFDEGAGLSSEAQQYDHTATINAVRAEIDSIPGGRDDPLPALGRWWVLVGPVRWRRQRLAVIVPCTSAPRQ